jgi:uncharacterized protein YuzE
MANYLMGDQTVRESTVAQVKVNYDTKTDTLSFILKENASVTENDEGKPGIILDYDGQGDLVSMEILDAARRVTEANRVDFQIAG